MNSLTQKLTELKTELLDLINQATTQEILENARVTALGRNGKINAIMDELKQLSIEEKRTFGPEINSLKIILEQAYANKNALFDKQRLQAQYEEQKYFDVTAYTPNEQFGSLHILTQVVEDLENIFLSMGYDIVDGPEIETSYYNFEALNIPKDHPAREHHDTFWINDTQLLRTHTSPVQIREIEKRSLPLAIFASGRTYRNEATDASHDFMFMQGECLYIDKNISISNLLATAQHFLQAFFNKKDLNIRVRPGYFPFVEPGLEIDASCPFCTDGCSTCKRTGWIELLGGGLVHPNILKTSGIDPNEYSGFAFGFGIERLAAIKYNINDIRLFHCNKLEFLKQF